MNIKIELYERLSRQSWTLKFLSISISDQLSIRIEKNNFYYFVNLFFFSEIHEWNQCLPNIFSIQDDLEAFAHRNEEYCINMWRVDLIEMNDSKY